MSAEAQVYNNSRDGGTRNHVDEIPPPDEWRWRVQAANGEIVASGEGYTTEADAWRGFNDAARAMAYAALDHAASVRIKASEDRST